MVGNPVKQFSGFAKYGLHGVVKGYKDGAKYALIDTAQAVPVAGDWLAEQLAQFFFGNLDVPKKILDTVDATLRSVGGYDKESMLPYICVDSQKSHSNPAFWTVGIDYLQRVKIDNIVTLERTIADRLCRAMGGRYNIRVVEHPVRIEVDRPEPPSITLSEMWDAISDYKRNSRSVFCGVRWQDKYTQSGFLKLDNMDSMVGIFGTTGSGKSQMATSILLSLAMNNHPDKLKMIICDPKAFDFKYLQPLPHVVGEVMEDAQAIYDIVEKLAKEVERRKSARKAGEEYLGPIICLYIDELEDLLDRIGDISAAHKKTFIANLATLTRQGRAYDYIVILASQAATGYDTKLTRNLNVRIVGKVVNGNAAADSAGVAGAQCHKLPGKGAFEVYQGGQLQARLQGAYVGDTKQPRAYTQTIKFFVDSIVERWGYPDTTLDLDACEIQKYEGLGLDLPEPLLDVLIETATDGALSAKKVMAEHKNILGSGINGAKAGKIRDAIRAYIEDEGDKVGV